MPDTVPLGSSGWRLWSDAMLRSAGFPLERLHALRDPALAQAADARAACAGRVDEAFRAEFEGSVERLSGALRTAAAEPLLREAVTWQNPALVGNCLDRLVAGERRNKRGRGHELTLTTYLQRYTLKNDTIGFFGPVAWARWGDGDARVVLRSGESFLERRTVYFESWAMDAFAAALAAEPAMLPWLVARLTPSAQLSDATVRLPGAADLALTGLEARIAGLCRVPRTARQIADALQDETEAGVFAALLGLRDRGVLSLGLDGPIEAFPERALRRRLETVDDPDLRRSVLARLDRIEDARDQVAAAAGDAEKLATAMARLDSVFHEETGAEAGRRAGRTYAGRRLVYEDTVRDLDVELGPTLLDELADPLELVLDTARWLVARIADEYRTLFQDLHARWAARSGEQSMPLARLVAMATPHLSYAGRSLPQAVRTAVEDFQLRWAEVLAGPASDGRLDLDCAVVAPELRAMMPAATAPWSNARHFSPDVMIAARSVADLASGRYLPVLGELHLAFNPLESRVAVEQHPRPERLCAQDAADHGGRRVYLIPPKDWAYVTSRLNPPSALLSPAYAYWSLRAESVQAPGAHLPLADLFVHEEDGELVVQAAHGPFRADLLEVLGELLSAVVVNAFRPFPPAPHRPRITLGGLVLSRESWRFDATGLAWAALKDEAERFAAARAWRAEAELPERAFFRVPVEEKPMYVDFTSPALVNLFAKMVRLTTEAPSDAGSSVDLSEVLPDVDQAWLTGHDGAAYACELRIVAVAPDGSACAR